MIPAEAVEAAAKAFYGTALDDVSPEDMEYALEGARSALEAAAPHMVRDAVADELAELAELIEPFSGIGLAGGATRGEIAQWIRGRAANYRTAL